MPLLFSYGTLQQEAVQLSTFGRLLHGQPDQLVGFEQSLLTIDDPEFVATSGTAHHAIVRFNWENRESSERHGVRAVRRRARQRRPVRTRRLQTDLDEAGVRQAGMGLRRRAERPASGPVFQRDRHRGVPALLRRRPRVRHDHAVGTRGTRPLVLASTRRSCGHAPGVLAGRTPSGSAGGTARPGRVGLFHVRRRHRDLPRGHVARDFRISPVRRQWLVGDVRSGS